MKKHSNLFVPVILALIITISISCNEDDEPLTAYGDAFITTIKRNDSVFYGLNLYAYSWSKMKEVNVSHNSLPFQVILDTLNYRYTHAFIPSESSFTEILPDSGIYIFEAVFDNGEEYTSTDYLDTSIILPPVVTEAVFDTTDQKFTVKWESVCNNCAYRVMLKDEENKIAFQTELLNYDQLSVSITQYTYGWQMNAQPYGGEKYTVVIMGFLFEPVPSSFDLQCVSINNENEFTWVYDDNEE
ncbi:MAG: hypothetical protein JW798_01845 [Prolixibacteraceae bacterium]|nr:hypothetical protein [Prolixibacteraceae bacterium]